MHKQKPSSMPQFGVCVCVSVTQSCLTLCDPIDCSPPGSSVHGILQARTVEWAVFSYSRGSFQTRDWTQVSCTESRLFTIWATRADLHSIQYYAICFLLLKAFLWGQSMISTQYMVPSGHNQEQFWLLLHGSDWHFFPGGISCTLSSPNSKLSVTLTLILEDKGLLVIWSLSGRGPRRGQ